MKFSVVKRYKRKHKILGALLLRNPVLVMGLDLPFVIAAATSLKNAVAMSIQLFLIHIVTMAVAIYTRRRLPLWLRAAVNVTVSTVMMMLAQALVVFLLRSVSDSLGMYLYLMAVNSMTMLQTSHMDRRAKPGPVLWGAALNALGFAVVALLVAALREYFGSGTLWGFPVASPIRLGGLLIPFSGFILVGFLLAFVRFVNKQVLYLSVRDKARRDSHRQRIHVESVETIDY